MNRGKVLTHAMLMLAVGGEACSDIEFLGTQDCRIRLRCSSRPSSRLNAIQVTVQRQVDEPVAPPEAFLGRDGRLFPSAGRRGSAGDRMAAEIRTVLGLGPRSPWSKRQSTTTDTSIDQGSRSTRAHHGDVKVQVNDARPQELGAPIGSRPSLCPNSVRISAAVRRARTAPRPR